MARTGSTMLRRTIGQLPRIIMEGELFLRKRLDEKTMLRQLYALSLPLGESGVAGFKLMAGQLRNASVVFDSSVYGNDVPTPRLIVLQRRNSVMRMISDRVAMKAGTHYVPPKVLLSDVESRRLSQSREERKQARKMHKLYREHNSVRVHFNASLLDMFVRAEQRWYYHQDMLHHCDISGANPIWPGTAEYDAQTVEQFERSRNCMLVFYEAFVADPYAEMLRIASFLRVDLTRPQRNALRQYVNEHTAANLLFDSDYYVQQAKNSLSNYAQFDAFIRASQWAPLFNVSATSLDSRHTNRTV